MPHYGNGANKWRLLLSLHRICPRMGCFVEKYFMAKKSDGKYSYSKYNSMTSLVSFDKSVAFHLTPVLPTFYDECKGLSAKMFTAALARQNTI